MVVVPLLAACGIPIQSGASFTPNWEMPPQSTFGWQDEEDRTVGDSRLEGSQFFHQRLHEAVEWELSLRGIHYSESNPTLLIHHHLSLSDHVLESEVIDEAGVSTTETYVYEGGSLVVHIEDALSREDVWVAWGESNVESAFTSPEKMRKWVYKLVGSMFEDWPVPPRIRP
jgi:hypothetical protein